MLAELEDEATRLTQRQNDLVKQLADVDAQLERIESIRSAMVGHRTPRAPRRAPASTEGRKDGRSQRRVERILQWAREREAAGQSEFQGRDVATFLEVNVQGVGPILAGMRRRGQVNVREDGHANRFYSLVNGGE
jgi:hypothetical protein